ncbi:hypothetical protein ACSQ67_015969 [Phaseolus vulgaris]
MGNEMGNNNTSAIKEEDNFSESQKKGFQEDTNETSIANVVKKASIDITNEPGKDEANDEDSQEKTTGFASNHTKRVLENDSMKGDTRASDVNMENQTPRTAEAEVVQEKAAAALVSEDTTTELEKVTLQEDSHEDYMKENMQMIPSDEGKDVQEEEAKAFQEEVTGLDSNNTKSWLKNDVLGEDTCKNDMNMENITHPTSEVEDVQEKDTGITSNYSRSSLENDLLEGDDPEDDTNVNHEKHKTVEEKFDELHIETRLDFDDETSEFDDKTQEDKQDAIVVNPTANGIDVQGKNIISASDAALKLTNSLEGSGDEITELRQPENSPNDGSVEAGGGKSEILSSFSLESSEEYEKQETCLREHLIETCNHHLSNEPSIPQGDEITEVRHPDNRSVVTEGGNLESLSSSSSLEDTEEYVKLEETCVREHMLVTDNHVLNNDPSIQQGDEEAEVRQHDSSKVGSVEAEGRNSESLSSSSLEGTEEYEKQEESCLREEILLTCNHHLDNEPPILQAYEEEMTVLTMSAVNMTNNIEIQESSVHYEHHEPDKFLSEQSFLGTDSLLEDNLLDTNSHSELIKDDGLAKEMESHEKLCTDKSGGKDGNELGRSLIDLSGTTSDSLSIDLTTNGNSLTKVICTTEDSLISPLEIDNEENCKAPYGKSILSRSGSMENSHYYKPDQCMKDSLKENNMVYTCDVSIIESNGECNGERNMSLDSNVSRLVTNDQVEEPKVTDNGVQFDAYINNPDSSELEDDEAFEKEGKEDPQDAEAASYAGAELSTSTATMSIIGPCSNKLILENGGYETRESITRLSTESNPENPNTSCQMQKSPSFNLNLRKEARPEESDKTPLLHQNKSANESFSKHINSMPHGEYEQCMLHSKEMPVEEKIVTMERSYSKKSKAPFIGLLKEEEEAHLLGMAQIQENHVGTKNTVSSTSHKRQEKRKPRSSFFSSCMCCATVP